MMTRNTPKIICLCGSTKFKDAFEKAEREIALKGEICLTVGLFGHLEGLDMTSDLKKRLDVLHLHKIDLADEILILNVGGYVGTSTMRELRYSMSKGKDIKFLEDKYKVENIQKAMEEEFK